jgi:hypothetical protein
VNTLKVIVIANDGTNQHAQELEWDLEALRHLPNPRQALVAGFLSNARQVVDQVDPSINI